jgi:nucleotide-binding universal stress UspA family protein
MSDPVVNAGLQVARAAGAKVALVHAFQPRMAYGSETPYVAEVVLVEALAAESALVTRRLEEQIERLGIRGEELAGKRVEYGPPHRALVEAAAAFGADLLVVGAAESAAVAKLFGSTADRVIRTSLRPVLVVRPPLAVPPHKALLPVDLSPLSAVAFRRGLAVLDRAAPGAEVEVEALYVMPETDRGLFEPAARADLSEPEAAREVERFVARNKSASDRAVAIRVAQGEVETAIRARSDEWGADLVVLGTHGRGGFERFLLGSVAADVVRRGTVSVLVIPPVVEAEEASPPRVQEPAVLAANA